MTYNVTDAAGDKAIEVVRKVTVTNSGDTTAPVIVLLGDPETEAGDTYIDAGATASDDRDGVITDQIVTVNPVDPSKLGEYTITYNVSDEADNAATQVTVRLLSWIRLLRLSF